MEREVDEISRERELEEQGFGQRGTRRMEVEVEIEKKRRGETDVE